MYRRIITAAVAATLLWSLTGCDRSTSPDNPTQQSEQTSTEDTDTTGEYGPYMRPNGGIGFGIDMGSGFNYNPSNGKVEYSPFGF